MPACRQIVRAHNCSITLKNNPGTGTSIILRLLLQPLITIGHINRLVNKAVRQSDDSDLFSVPQSDWKTGRKTLFHGRCLANKRKIKNATTDTYN